MVAKGALGFDLLDGLFDVLILVLVEHFLEHVVESGTGCGRLALTRAGRRLWRSRRRFSWLH